MEFAATWDAAQRAPELAFGEFELFYDIQIPQRFEKHLISKILTVHPAFYVLDSFKIMYRYQNHIYT